MMRDTAVSCSALAASYSATPAVTGLSSPIWDGSLAWLPGSCVQVSLGTPQPQAGID